MTDAWDRRLRRAEVLEKEWPFAAALLRFMRDVYRVQARIARDLEASAARKATPPSALFRFLPSLLDAVERHGSEPLREKAREFRGLDGEFWERYVDMYLKGHFKAEPRIESFFIRALLEPLSGFIVPPPAPPPEGAASPNTCPACGFPPGVAVLREDKAAEALRRSLVCSLCAREWDFPRVVCPKCREEAPEKLPRFTAQEIPWVRIEACDACQTYLKAVDLTKAPEAEPVVDELASLPLDVIAAERGYAKLATNLAGM